MSRQDKRPREGILREDAGTADAEGFIAPSIGALEHTLFFTTAPSVTEKARQVLDQGRLLLPGAAVVWDESIGRRKGAKAIPKAWWAAAGSLTVAFALQRRLDIGRQERLTRIAGAVIRVVASFLPRATASFRPVNDLLIGDRKVGAVFFEPHAAADLAVVRLKVRHVKKRARCSGHRGACRVWLQPPEDRRGRRGQFDPGSFDRRWVEAVAAKDVQALAAFYSPDGVLMGANAPAVVGRDAIQQWFEGAMQAPSLTYRFTPEVVEVAASGDLAYDRGTYDLAMDAPQGRVNDHGK